MIFSEKLKKLRKEKGLSQEDLANELNISRQAVSKWESGQGFPETDKMIMISNMFNVSLDYLLKEENGLIESTGEFANIPAGYYASRETVDGFMDFKKKKAAAIALAVAVIIIGVVPVLLLDGYNETISIVLFLGFVIVGVSMLILNAFKANRYEDIEKQPLLFDNSLLEEVKGKFAYEKRNCGKLIAVGVGIILLSFIFRILMDGYSKNVDIERFTAILPMMWAISVYMFIMAGSAISAMNIIINNEDHVKEQKESEKYGWLFGLASMLFLLIGFIWGAWHPGWIIFPITAMIVAGLTQLRKIN